MGRGSNTAEEILYGQTARPHSNQRAKTREQEALYEKALKRYHNRCAKVESIREQRRKVPNYATFLVMADPNQEYCKDTRQKYGITQRDINRFFKHAERSPYKEDLSYSPFLIAYQEMLVESYPVGKTKVMFQWQGPGNHPTPEVGSRGEIVSYTIGNWTGNGRAGIKIHVNWDDGSTFALDDRDQFIVDLPEEKELPMPSEPKRSDYIK